MRPKPIYVLSYASRDLDQRGHRDGARISEVLHKLRDGDAQANLLDALAPAYRRADTIPLYPPKAFKGNVSPTGRMRLPSDSLLLTATRPPLNDADWKEKGDATRKTVERGYTDLESQVFDSLRCLIATSRREHLCLQSRLADEANPLPLDNRFLTVRDAVVRERRLIGAKKAKKIRVPENTTVGYVIYQPSIRGTKPGPGLLACFAMSGPAGLVWSLLLLQATRQDDGIFSLRRIVRSRRPRVIAADFSFPKLDRLPLTLGSLIDRMPTPNPIVNWPP
jgi:hypothetical protein